MNYGTTSDSFTVNASSNKTVTITATAAGWYPVGVVGFCASDGAFNQCYVKNWNLTGQSVGSATVTFGIHNFSSSAITTTMNVMILWVK